MLRTPSSMQNFLLAYARGLSIANAVTLIGGKSEETIRNWRKASARDPRPVDESSWAIFWPPGPSAKLTMFHVAYAGARTWFASTSPLRRDLESRLVKLRSEGPTHSRPEDMGLPREWSPEEKISDPTKPLHPPKPQTILDHPRVYHVPPLQKPRPFYARAPLTRAGQGSDEPPLEGRMTMVTESIPYAARIKTGPLQVHDKR